MKYQILLLLLLSAQPIVGQAKKRPKRCHRPEYWCLRALKKAGVPFRSVNLKIVRTPIKLTHGRIGRLILNNGAKRAKPTMDCRTALTLLQTGRIFRANGGINTLIVGKFYSYRYVKNSAS
ncbi:hypothetical protein KKF84_13850, partial [Myxococcota bacterium]|nr:hypothetical protein [Myxococcota bacterium]MBU1536405.1 hypothetical protein [Myxococcota bacterium]